MSFRLLCHSPLILTLFPLCLFFFNDTAPTEIYTLSLHDPLPISGRGAARPARSSHGRKRARSNLAPDWGRSRRPVLERSEEHTSELQSLRHLVCRLLLEKKKTNRINTARRME